MASYEKLNNELEQMKAKFMALSSEEEEREFRKEMEAFVASKPTEDREVLAKVFIDVSRQRKCMTTRYVPIWMGYMNLFHGLMLHGIILVKVARG